MPKNVVLEVDPSVDIPTPTITVHPNLPTVAFYLVMTALGKSGKTVLICDMMLNKYKKVFKKGDIFIFTESCCPTILSMAKKRKARVFDSVVSDSGINRIQQIFDIQKARKEDQLPLHNVCIILDDMIANPIFQKRRSALVKAFTQARHYAVSIIITSQAYTLTPKSIRVLATHHIIFKVGNQEEIKIMSKELCLWLSEEDFKAVYEVACSEQYNFLQIQCHDRKFLKNFTNVLMSQY